MLRYLSGFSSRGFAGRRIAVRQNGALSYLHGAQLSSTAVTTGNSGAATNSVRYLAYGGVGAGNPAVLPPDHTFTGQKSVWGAGLAPGR